MARLWVVLSTTWKLQDVQAAVNVVIGVVSGLGIYAFARFCWQRSSAQVAKNFNAPLTSLLTLTTPGEAFDVIHLLRRRIFSPRYLWLLAQCIVVMLLSISAILSGPIARYSTQRGRVTSPVAVRGSLATIDHNSISSASVRWNETQFSLDRAGFPIDQLLDYLPDPSVHWVYKAEEWNSTWSAYCNSTPSTPIHLTSTGIFTGEDVTLFAEIPGIRTVFPERFLNESTYWINPSVVGFYDHLDRWKDNLIFLISTGFTEVSSDEKLVYSISTSIAAVHLHRAPRSKNVTLGSFGPGPIPKASYTRVDCDLSRLRSVPDEQHMAYPWTWDTSSLAIAFYDNYAANFVQQSVASSKLYHPSGEDLFRFYQVYMITKDTQYHEPVTREMSAQVNTVELSAIFLAVILCLTLLIAAGIARYFFFARSNRSSQKFAPESKLDWMLQSIKEARVNSESTERYSPLSATISRGLYDMPKQGLRVELEASSYGALELPSQKIGPRRVRRGFTIGYVEMVPPPMQGPMPMQMQTQREQTGCKGSPEVSTTLLV